MEKEILLKPKDIKYIIVHHSATNRDFTTFRAVRNHHINQRGFFELAYHFFIDDKGMIHYARPIYFVGAHCKTSPPSMNLRSLGICLAGNFEKEEPSKEQLEALDYQLKFLMVLCKIPSKNVLGHCQVEGTATLCPGINLLRWLDEWHSKQKNSLKIKIINQIEIIKQIIKKLIARIGKPSFVIIFKIF